MTETEAGVGGEGWKLGDKEATSSDDERGWTDEAFDRKKGVKREWREAFPPLSSSSLTVLSQESVTPAPIPPTFVFPPPVVLFICHDALV